MKVDFDEFESALELAPPGDFSVDDLRLKYGREALASGAAAMRRAAHHHRLALDDPERTRRLRRALMNAIDACERIRAEANLSAAARASTAFESAARADLDKLPPPLSRGRGSPGRVVHAAVAEAVAEVWASAEGRHIPRSGKVRDNHPLKALLHAVAADLFGARGELSVSLLYVRKK